MAAFGQLGAQFAHALFGVTKNHGGVRPLLIEQTRQHAKPAPFIDFNEDLLKLVGTEHCRHTDGNGITLKIRTDRANFISIGR